MDNAKEAAVLSESKKVSICIYIVQEEIVFEISNTFNDEVNLDEIYNSGYSSKGKSRGHGLSLVKAIVDESSIFENDTTVNNEYFVQTLRVKKK